MSVQTVPPPADHASWFSQFFFLFISPVLSRGVENGGLTQDDLPLLSRSDHPGRMVADFLSTRDRKQIAVSGKGLFARILKLYWLRYTISGLCLLVTNLSALAIPIIMHELLDFLSASSAAASSVSNPPSQTAAGQPSPSGGPGITSGSGSADGPTGPNGRPLWYGYALALALAAASAGQACVIHQFWYQSAVVCIHSEVILTSLVYAKALSISNAARATLGLTRGKLVNHMAVDACRLNETWVFPFLHWNTWSAALTVSVAIAYLYGLLGPAGLIGCAVTLVFVPLSTAASRAAKKYSEAIQKRRDARGTLISEAVSGFLTLKAYGWTDWFGERVAKAREAEMQHMRKKQYLSVLGDFIGQLAPIAVMTTTFSLYGYLRPGVSLTAAIAFSSMSWFDQLRQPLRSIPNTITTFVDASVSMKRLRQLLDAEDTDVGSMQAWRRVVAQSLSTAELKLPAEMGALEQLDATSDETVYPMTGWLRPASLLLDLDLGQNVCIAPARGHSGGSSKASTRPTIAREDADSAAEALLEVEAEPRVGGMSYKDYYNDGFRHLLETDEAEESSGVYDDRTRLQASSSGGDSSYAVVVQSASFGWYDVEPAEMGADKGRAHCQPSGTATGPHGVVPVLHEISLSCPRGTVTLIVGPVGAGKSSLLSSLIGETTRLQGSVHVAGSMAYAAQAPWILNRSIQDNITFVSDYNQAWMVQVARACALDVDVAGFRDGYSTLVGDAGITLSGGQKQRLALARALYADADVYILDDVLSAVDATVAAQIWSEAVVSLLTARGKTVLMATHAVHYCARPEVSQILVLNGQGRVQACGTYEQLREDPTCMSVLARSKTGTTLAPATAMPSEGTTQNADEEQAATSETDVEPSKDEGKMPVHKSNAGTTSSNSGAKGNEESYAKGLIAAKAMWRFVKAMGSPPLLVTLVGLYVCTQGLVIGCTWWMALWVEAVARPDVGPGATAYYAGGYAALNAAVALASLLRMTILAYGTMRAGTTLHNGAVTAVLNAPATFFAANPAGRITNRFLADVSTVDNAVRYSISSFALQVFSAVGIVTVIAATTPYVLLWIIALSVVYYKLSQRYRISARDMRRLQSTAKSPILSHFSETLRGVATIRAFGPKAATVFVRRHLEVSAVHLRAWLAYWAANEYISCWLELIGCCVILAAALLAVYEHSRGTLSSGDVGLTLTYNMQIPGVLMWLVRSFSLVETDAVAIERLSEYCDIPSEEEQSSTKAQAAPEGAPATAAPSLPDASLALQLANVHLSYEPTERAPHILRGLSLSLPRGLKMAVLGRTGAGKSTILQALLRMHPIEYVERSSEEVAVEHDHDDGEMHETPRMKHAGFMWVGGLDVSARSMSCSQARQHVTALLQDGFLFTGSVRENLLGPLATLSVQPPALVHSGEGVNAEQYAPLPLEPGVDGYETSIPMSVDLDRVVLQCLQAVGMHGPSQDGVQHAGDIVGDSARGQFAMGQGQGAAIKLVQLDDPVTDAGSNFSAGERALLSLARALVRQRVRRAGIDDSAHAKTYPHAPVLIVADEPTAAVDASSDALVHAALLNQPDALLCICHRLVHVPRFDLVAVVVDGKVVEVGTPAQLAARPGSEYSKLRAAAAASGHI